MTPAVQVAEQAKISFELHRYAHGPAAGQHDGWQVVSALGLPPEQVFKTLLAAVDSQPVVAMVPVSAQLDLKLLARAHGGKKGALCSGEQAQRLTGYRLGGISPLGQKQRLPLYLAETARDWGMIYMSGGRRGLEMAMAPLDLLALTEGSAVELVRHG